MSIESRINGVDSELHEFKKVTVSPSIQSMFVSATVQNINKQQTALEQYSYTLDVLQPIYITLTVSGVVCYLARSIDLFVQNNKADVSQIETASAVISTTLGTAILVCILTLPYSLSRSYIKYSALDTRFSTLLYLLKEFNLNPSEIATKPTEAIKLNFESTYVDKLSHFPEQVSVFQWTTVTLIIIIACSYLIRIILNNLQK